MSTLAAHGPTRAAPRQPRAPRPARPRRVALRQVRRSRLAYPGLAIVLVFVFCGVFAPLIAPYDPYKNDLMNVLMPPSAEHWFGTDELGRDLFSRILFGARISLAEGVLSVALAMAVGVPIGIVSGY